jgi:RecG-like helicase
MGIRNLFKQLGSSEEELESKRLATRFETLPCNDISTCKPRELLCVGGEVKRMRVVPRSGAPWFEVVISDGTGDITAVFTGRRSIGGISHGRSVILQGVAQEERGRLLLLNPAYTLVSQHS